ncbi:LysR substrate-binding domain-containing protein [Arthrobacter sp. NPDC057009]|uniref:LysR substrate-binding domain-containing protein n=1 Tax=Arthrobacter sp. NPDC057009 TaxID=3345996 RepID=UPI00362BABBD
MKLMLSMRDLEQYLVLAEELNFRLAADRLHVSQPTLTQTLQRLERLLGSTLIERSTRKSHLTEAGRTLYEGAELLLGDAKKLEIEVRNVGAGMRRELRVGAVNPAMGSLMPQILQAVHRSYPDVRISLQPMASFALMRALRDGRLDIAIVRTADSVPGFVATELMNDALLAVLPAAHPLASREKIKLAELSGESFIMAPRSRNPAFHDELVSLYHRRGCSPSQFIESNGLHSQLALVGAEVGVAVQSVLYRDLGREDIVFVAVGENLEIPLQVLTQDTDSELIRCFIAAAQVRAREINASLSAGAGG